MQSEMRLQRQHGATTAEYLIATAVVIAMLFMPLPGQENSVVEMLVEALKENHEGYIWSMSYPL